MLVCVGDATASMGAAVVEGGSGSVAFSSIGAGFSIAVTEWFRLPLPSSTLAAFGSRPHWPLMINLY